MKVKWKEVEKVSLLRIFRRTLGNEVDTSSRTRYYCQTKVFGYCRKLNKFLSSRASALALSGVKGQGNIKSFCVLHEYMRNVKFMGNGESFASCIIKE
jgi:hypothetical protein